MSTNKVYGDAPNRIKLKEYDTRWDYDDHSYENGISETFPIDQSKHSLFGASKVAADIMVQEYGRYFGMATCCLRGGCLTGPSHSGVELHGFLSYLVKCNLEGRKYKIFGYKGKQVRDNIHSEDVAQFIALLFIRPKVEKFITLAAVSPIAVQLSKPLKSVRKFQVKNKFLNTRKRTASEITYATTVIYRRLTCNILRLE